MKLLRIDSSARRNSVSRQLTQRFVESWKKENSAGEVVERDLATTPLPPITDEWTLALHSDPAKRTPAQQEALAVSDLLQHGFCIVAGIDKFPNYSRLNVFRKAAYPACQRRCASHEGSGHHSALGGAQVCIPNAKAFQVMPVDLVV